MKIFLTGGTGFIGSHFLNQALAQGHAVTALRRSPQSRPRIPLTEQPIWLDGCMDQVSTDKLRNCDVLVHLAAHSGNPPYDTLTSCLRWNLMSVLVLFEQARQAGIQHYIVAGSCAEYGSSGERYDAIPTDAPLEPTSSYAASKAAASIALRQWAEQHCLSMEILRVFHVFGEGEPETRLWSGLRRAALAGEDFPMTLGEQIREFCHVEDVAAVFIERARALLSRASSTKIFNLSSGRRNTILEFSAYWWQKWGAHGRLLIGSVPYRPSEVMRYVAGPHTIITGAPN